MHGQSFQTPRQTRCIAFSKPFKPCVGHDTDLVLTQAHIAQLDHRAKTSCISCFVQVRLVHIHVFYAVSHLLFEPSVEYNMQIAFWQHAMILNMGSVQNTGDCMTMHMAHESISDKLFLPV